MILTYEYKGRVSDIEFDTLVRSNETIAVTVTEHAVEKGANVNDHVRQQPDRLSVEAMVSNTPIVVPQTQMRGVSGSFQSTEVQYQNIDRPPVGLGPASALLAQPVPKSASVNMLKFTGQFDRVRDVYGELRLIKENGLTCSIRLVEKGGLVDYTDMVIVNLGTVRETTSGSARSFSIDFQRIRIVDTRKVALSKKATKKKGSKGATKKKTDEKKPLESIAHKALSTYAPGLLPGGG